MRYFAVCSAGGSEQTETHVLKCPCFDWQLDQTLALHLQTCPQMLAFRRRYETSAIVVCFTAVCLELLRGVSFSDSITSRKLTTSSLGITRYERMSLYSIALIGKLVCHAIGGSRRSFTNASIRFKIRQAQDLLQISLGAGETLQYNFDPKSPL